MLFAIEFKHFNFIFESLHYTIAARLADRVPIPHLPGQHNVLLANPPAGVQFTTVVNTANFFIYFFFIFFFSKHCKYTPATRPTSSAPHVIKSQHIFHINTI